MTISDYLCNPQQQNALSFNEIKDMLQEELDSLISICFHEGKLRTYEQGISNIKYNKKITGSKYPGRMMKVITK